MQFHNPLIMGNLFHFIFEKGAAYGTVNTVHKYFHELVF
jgi:hypothetical protein